jgi:acyl carrier protein
VQSEEIYSALNAIFEEVFFRDDIKLRPDLTAQDVEGWTSYKQVEIVLATEERFGIRLHSREINGLTCVGDLVDLIAQKTA